MKIIKIFSLIGFWLMWFSPVHSQLNKGGIPISFENASCISTGDIHCISFPPQDNILLIKADSLSHIGDSAKFNNQSFGITLNANYGLDNSGTWEILADSSKLWYFIKRNRN